ncbi:MAG: YjgN family protein [Alphaproteobacteria bacterium]
MDQSTLSPIPRIAPQQQTHGFVFSGQAGEFFRIWIVNIALSFLTLGIYSAWAKVRTKRYFYGHTSIAGSSFEYLADPISILKGRIIALLLIAIYFAVASEGPVTEIALTLMAGEVSDLLVAALVVQGILIIVLPYIFVMGLRFRARVTRYRNVRFDYKDSYGGAMWPLVVFPGAVLFIFPLIWPWADAVRRNHILNRYRFGNAIFGAQVEAGALFRIYIVGFLLLGAAIVGGVVVTIIGSLQTPTLLPLLVAGGAVFLWAWSQAYILGRILNHMFETLSVGPHIRFKSRLDPIQLGLIAATNWLAVIASLGLAWPWAKIRMAKYRAETLSIIAHRSVDDITGEAQEDLAATGDEVMELGGLDIGF